MVIRARKYGELRTRKSEDVGRAGQSDEERVAGRELEPALEVASLSSWESDFERDGFQLVGVFPKFTLYSMRR